MKIPSLPYSAEDPYEDQIKASKTINYNHPINLEIGMPSRVRESVWMSRRAKRQKRLS